MISHYLTLEALSAELRESLSGAVIEEVYTQSKHELLSTLRTRDGEEKTLVFCVASGRNALFVRDGRMRAKRNSTDLFPEIFGGGVTWISPGTFSREIVIEAGRFAIRACLFNNATANVFLEDGDGTAISAFTSSEEAVGKRSNPGMESSAGAFPDAAGLAAALSRSSEALSKVLKGAFPWLGPVLQREVFFRAKLDDSAPANTSGARAASALVDAVTALRDEARTPRPVIYPATAPEGATTDIADGIFSVVRLTHHGVEPLRSFSSVNEGVRECFSARRREEGLEEERTSILETLEKERKKTAKSLAEATRRASDTGEAERHRATGTLLLTNLHRIRKGDTEAILEDPDGREVNVKLDRALTPAANANAYFDKARKAEAALGETAPRIASLTAKLARLDELLGEARTSGTLRDLRGIRERMRSGKDAPVTTPEGERLPYKVFPIGEKYEAWVGKSSSDNDELTFRHAGPHDWWMHVRGSPGSHVVLRSRSGGAFDPPKEALRAAAKIAAYYSKMKRAGMVPVAYCERKYVKKPKNAPPGTVTLSREEVIFVEPGLP